MHPFFSPTQPTLRSDIRKSNIGHVAAFVATRLKEDNFLGGPQGLTLEDEETPEDGGFHIVGFFLGEWFFRLHKTGGLDWNKISK